MKYLKDPQILLTALCGAFLAASFIPGLEVAAYLSVACGSYFAFRSAWDSLRERSIDVNLLMVLAAIGAVVVGQPKDAAALLFLFSLSNTLEALAMSRTKSAIESLMKLRPDTAILVLPGGDVTKPVHEIQPGDLVRVLPFEHVPTDGIVEQGESSVNQASMTGESAAVSRTVGEKVLAGTQNLEGMLVLRVTSGVGDSTLDKIVGLVREAQENKASGERISAWFGQRYTVFVIVAFIASLAVRLAFGVTWPVALYASLTLLVALSPCALVISTPATTLTALAWAARNGILIRGGEYIERSGKIDTIAVDKTGTLTTGEPRLTEICVCSVQSGSTCLDESACWKTGDSMSDEASKMLGVAAAAEVHSTHPIAQALVERARAQGIEFAEAEHVNVIPGFGITAEVGGKEVRVGQRRLFERDGAKLDPDFAAHVEDIQLRGMTVVIVSWGDRRAALGFRDAPRPEAKAFLEELKSEGVTRVVLLTGDTAQTAKAVAEELGITEYQAGLLPDDKTRIVTELVQNSKGVMMVGDGINDAPSLARASVGVAMGGLGSDIALNAADVVLMQDRLDRIPALLRLGKRTNSTIRANLIFAAGVIVILTTVSLFGVLPLPLAVVGHEGSTVLVILNGLRLLKGPGAGRRVADSAHG